MKKPIHYFVLITLLFTLTVTFSQNNALSFDGIDDFISIPDNTALDYPTEFTIEAWIKPKRVDINMGILGKYSSTALGEKAYQAILKSDGTNAVLELSISHDGVAETTLTTTTNIPANTWSHFAFTYDGTSLIAYVDGVKEANIVSTSGGIHNSNQPLTIGLSLDSYFFGTIDEVRLSDKAFTQTEITGTKDCKITSIKPTTNIYNFGFDDGDVWGDNTSISVETGVSTGLAIPFSLSGTLNGFDLTGTDSNFVDGVDVPFVDTPCEPITTTLSPVDDKTDVAIDSDFSITFDENVQKGSGNILIKDASDNSIVFTIDIAGSEVTIDGATVLINPTSNLPSNTSFYIQVPDTGFTDNLFNAFAGYLDTTSWNFSTGTNTRPIFTSTPLLSINDDTTYNYEVTTSDSEGQEVTILAPTLPSWLTFSTTVNVSTLAGNGSSGYLDGTSSTAIFNYPRGLAVDASGNIYVADGSNNRIRKITPTGVVTTLAGSGVYDFADGTGTAASFAFPIGIAIDASGNLYVGDSGNNRIRKITPTGVVTTLAGSTQGFLDGTGTAAQFDSPAGLDIDASGNVYVADANNNRIRKISPSGVVTTVAGTGAYSYLDGTTNVAQFSNPSGVAVDDFGNIYIADTDNFKVRKISSGVVSTIVFAGGAEDVAVDASGNLYVATGNGSSLIRKITRAGVFSVLAGGSYGDVDGIGTVAEFSSPIGITVDASGIVYVTDQNNQKIKKITTTTKLSGDAAGQGGTHNVVLNADDGFGGANNQDFTITVNDVTAPLVLTLEPANNATDVNSNTNLVITFDEDVIAGFADILVRSTLDNTVIQTIDVTSSDVSINGAVVTINLPVNLPSGSYYIEVPNTAITDDAGASTNFLSSSNAFAGFVDKTGWSFVIRTNNPPAFTSTPVTAVNDDSEYIYYVSTTDADGDTVTITSPNLPSWLTLQANPVRSVVTIAGSGHFGNTDGIGTNAEFDFPTDICVDSADNLFVTDTGNNKIRKITPDGIVTTFAGSGIAGDVDGTGTAAQFNRPSGICIDTFDNLFFIDKENNKVKKITPDGVVTTIAGSGISGDVDGSCADAQFNRPIGICIGPNDDLFLTDTGNNKIKKISKTSSSCTVSTIAGGSGGFQDGMGTAAQFDGPAGICIDSNSNLLVCDQFNNKIRKISTTGAVTSYGEVSGVGTFCDATANSSCVDPADGFDWPTGITVDSTDNIYITDQRNNKIKKLAAIPFSLTHWALSVLFGTGGGGSIDDVVDNATIDYPFSIEIDDHGNIYFTEQSFSKVRKIKPENSAVISGDAAGQAGVFSFYFEADDNFGDIPVQQGYDLTVTDVTSPTVDTFVPADNATGVTSSDLELGFSEEVQLGFGDVFINNISDGSLFGTFPVNTGGFAEFINASFKSVKTTVTRTTVKLHFGKVTTLPSNTSLSIQIPNTAFLDLSGKPYAGISDNTTWTFTTGTVLGIEDNIIKGFALYPNPVKESFRITTQEQIKEVEIYNLLGQLLKYKAVNNSETTISTAKLPVGTYFAKIRTDKTLKSVKFIKE